MPPKKLAGKETGVEHNQADGSQEHWDCWGSDDDFERKDSDESEECGNYRQLYRTSYEGNRSLSAQEEQRTAQFTTGEESNSGEQLQLIYKNIRDQDGKFTTTAGTEPKADEERNR